MAWQLRRAPLTTRRLFRRVIQFGTEGKIGFVDHLHGCRPRPEEDAAGRPFVLDIVSYQHPDHDTTTRPEERNS